jgi:hypothetical protein
MIFAEIHGKLGVNYSRAHDRAEDLLTSTVFGLLRYIPSQDWLLAVMRRVRSVRSVEGIVTIQQDFEWLDVAKVATVTVDFWPYWTAIGEPDILLTLEDAVGCLVAMVLVEAKIHAPKSGRAVEDDDELADDAIPDPDQLVRYWQGLRNRVPGKAQARIIYLTKHGAPPTQELGESIRREPGMKLAWLSWRDIWAVA